MQGRPARGSAGGRPEFVQQPAAQKIALATPRRAERRHHVGKALGALQADHEYTHEHTFTATNRERLDSQGSAAIHALLHREVASTAKSLLTVQACHLPAAATGGYGP